MMSQTLAQSKPHADAIIRSSLYKLLSSVFRYPTPETFETFKNGEFLAELRDKISLLPYPKSLIAEQDELTGKIQNDLGKINFQDFEVGFVQTFDVGTPEPPCPPYEGFYRQGIDRTAIMIEVSEFYKHFGLIMNPDEGRKELPDHLCAELEFLHFLIFKEAQARREGDSELLKGYILAQKDFIERHMMQWIQKFSDKLQSSSRVPFYAQLAKILLKFIADDFEFIKSNPEYL